MNDGDLLPASCGAALFTRAWPNRAAVEEFDTWQRRRHFPDLVALPGVARADYYRTVDDDLPQVLRGTGNRIAVYWGRSVEELLTFLTHPGLAEAVQDGSRFFPQFNELDGDTYTGNIYRFAAATPAGTAPSTGAQPTVLLAQRFEVTGVEVAEFTSWLDDVHAPQLVAVATVCSVRTGEAVRRDLPVPYYNSLGSHVVLAALSGGAAALAEDGDLLAALAAGQTWDRRLRYVRREVAELAFSAAPTAAGREEEGSG